MTRKSSVRWGILLALNVACWCVLGFQQSWSQAQNTNGELPFANAVEQRFQIIEQLKQVNAQLKEQNALLRSGTVKVLVSLDPAAPAAGN